MKGKLSLHYLIPGLLVTAAVMAVLLHRRAAVPVTTKPAISLKMRYPLTQVTITSAFGNRTHPITRQAEFHNGIDLAGAVGTPVLAPASGQVIKLYTNAIGGKQLLVLHNNGVVSGYAHLSAYLVKLNDHITQGQHLADVGATGQVTGPHLHFTLRDAQGNYLNPVLYLS